MLFPLDVCENFMRHTYDALINQGFIPTKMPVLQNADQILDTIGERSRSELFFVENNDMHSNALRYDFTLPIAQHYLNHAHEYDYPEQKIVCKGSVFRRRQNDDDISKSSEFQQIGLEFIGHHERTKTDAECLAITLDIVSEHQKHHLTVEIADIGLSRAICEMPIIPPIKAGRLRSALRHREKFMRLLKSETGLSNNDTLITLGKLPHDEASRIVNDIFKITGLKHSGLRSQHDIVARFVKKAEELQEKPLDDHVATLLARFYDLECPAETAADKIHHLLSEINPDIDDYLQYFERRLDILRSYNVNINHLVYGPLLKRKPEYYSGFIFSIDSPIRKSKSNSLAGGGRYDDLFKLLGSEKRIPAVGSEIRPAEITDFFSYNLNNA